MISVYGRETMVTCSCEGSQYTHPAPVVPMIPTASLSQLQNHAQFSIPTNPPPLPTLPPAQTAPTSTQSESVSLTTPPSSNPTAPNPPARPQQRSSIFPSLETTPAPSTPPNPPRTPLLFTPPLPRPAEEVNSLFPRSRPLAEPPPEPVLRPQPVMQLQQVRVANTRAHPFYYPRYIAKVSLVDNGPGRIVSKYKIPGGGEEGE